MSPTPICVIGAAGLIGLRHTQHCLDEPTVELTCIVDPTPAGVALAEKIKVPLFSSTEELLLARAAGTVKIAGAIVATPNSSHVTIGVQLARAGVYALVEKPMSVDSASGRELVAASEGSAKLLVGHHRRFNPYIVNTKKILDSGTLGTILAVQGLWTALKAKDYFEGTTSWRKEPAAGGVILINLVHDIDLMCYLFGDVVRVYCESCILTRGHPVEETGACTLKFRSGAVGTFIFSDAAASPYNFESATGENPLMPKQSQNIYTIIGTTGSVSFPELKVWHYASSAQSWTDELRVEEAEPVDSTPPFTVQLRHFARVCEGVEEANCSGLEALKSILTLEAIRESLRTGLPVEVAQG